MKLSLLLYGMMMVCGVARGQLWNNYTGFGRFTIAVPDSVSRSAAALAAYIQHRYDAPKAQLRHLRLGYCQYPL